MVYTQTHTLPNLERLRQPLCYGEGRRERELQAYYGQKTRRAAARLSSESGFPGGMRGAVYVLIGKGSGRGRRKHTHTHTKH
eukprot:7740302-Heterocapsa_arctica.AAC.1